MGSDFGGRHYLQLGLEQRQARYRARLPNLAPSSADVGHYSRTSLRRRRKCSGNSSQRHFQVVTSPLPSGPGALKVVPSRQTANRIPASRRARATTATYFPRRLATLVVQRLKGSASAVGRERRTAQAAWTSRRRMRVPPCFVIRPREVFSPELCSRGTNPR